MNKQAQSDQGAPSSVLNKCNRKIPFMSVKSGKKDLKQLIIAAHGDLGDLAVRIQKKEAVQYDDILEAHGIKNSKDIRKILDKYTIGVIRNTLVSACRGVPNFDGVTRAKNAWAEGMTIQDLYLLLKVCDSIKKELHGNIRDSIQELLDTVKKVLVENNLSLGCFIDDAEVLCLKALARDQKASKKIESANVTPVPAALSTSLPVWSFLSDPMKWVAKQYGKLRKPSVRTLMGFDRRVLQDGTILAVQVEPGEFIPAVVVGFLSNSSHKVSVVPLKGWYVGIQMTIPTFARKYGLEGWMHVRYDCNLGIVPLTFKSILEKEGNPSLTSKNPKNQEWWVLTGITLAELSKGRTSRLEKAFEATGLFNGIKKAKFDTFITGDIEIPDYRAARMATGYENSWKPIKVQKKDAFGITICRRRVGDTVHNSEAVAFFREDGNNLELLVGKKAPISRGVFNHYEMDMCVDEPGESKYAYKCVKYWGPVFINEVLREGGGVQDTIHNIMKYKLTGTLESEGRAILSHLKKLPYSEKHVRNIMDVKNPLFYGERMSGVKLLRKDRLIENPSTQLVAKSVVKTLVKTEQTPNIETKVEVPVPAPEIKTVKTTAPKIEAEVEVPTVTQANIIPHDGINDMLDNIKWAEESLFIEPDNDIKGSMIVCQVKGAPYKVDGVFSIPAKISKVNADEVKGVLEKLNLLDVYGLLPENGLRDIAGRLIEPRKGVFSRLFGR